MGGIRLKGVGPAILAAILCNQFMLIVCTFQNAVITPVFALISTAVMLWWHWTQVNWRGEQTQEDRRQIWIAGVLFSMPTLWVGAGFSFYKLADHPVSLEWVLNAANLFAFAAACLALGFKNFWARLGSSR